ncbi:MAG: glucose-6-phosphate isomerase [Alphaproteobacteria bacterium]|nr:glucose-6-phosphate isomerase [Alphaproteobacteria bacterium]
MSAKLTEKPEWKALEAHCDKTRADSLRDLFAADPKRAEHFSLKVDGLAADFSRHRLTDETVSLLVKLAEAQNLADWRARMLRGDKINNTEDRAVLHTALRTPSDKPVTVDGRDVIPDVRALQKRMAAFTGEVREGRWLGATGKPIRDVVNIGIGGSDLGPRLAVGALRSFASGPRVHFVANADAADLLGVLEGLDPATTLFAIVSKTFTTQETLLNAATARQWLVGRLGEAAVARHFVAVSTNLKAVKEFGIDDANVFPMWDWVGGRFSLWSSVGLSVALAIGWNNFKALLDGAAVMDEHFFTAPLARNVPVLMALAGIWNRNFRGSACLAVLPYSERLRDLPRYLQQLEMESNGKSVTREGEAVDYATAPALFGECGTIGQHSFHQWLHQGTDVTPADFIGVREDDLGKPEHHRALLANMEAQAEALKLGRQADDPRRTNPGNRPSTLLWLDRLDPRGLGLLLALYEHKVFVQGVVWEINSFDQWGVELGKALAKEAMK